MVRLRDGLTVLWRRPGESQIGLDPRCGVLLEDLDDGDQRLLDELRRDPSLDDLARDASDWGLAAERVRELIGVLERAGVLAPEDGLPRGGAESPDRGPGGPDAAYWSRIRADGDGWGVLTRRDARTVAVLGCDRLGMLVASGLAAAGIGTVLLADLHRVAATDLAPGAFDPRHLGRPREDAGVEVLRAVSPRVRTAAPPRTRPDLCVLVEHGVADPVRARPLVREDLPHLSVVVGEIDVTIGPLVRPGAGPCLRCLDLHRCDADERWPVLATQVAAAPGDGVESSLAALAAAVTVAQILAAVDGREPDVAGCTLAVGANDLLPRRDTWTPHPDCGCVAVPAVADDRTPAGVGSG